MINYVDDDLVENEYDDDDHHYHHGDLAGDADEAEGDGSGEMRPVLAQRAQCPLPVSILYSVFHILNLIFSFLNDLIEPSDFFFPDTLLSTPWLSTTCPNTSSESSRLMMVIMVYCR